MKNGITLFAAILGCALVQSASSAEFIKIKEKVLHSFSGPDGQVPVGLIDVRGRLYGATNAGGASGGGAVFALDLKTGTETVLHSFCSQQNCMDGENPVASLIEVSGVLYGTTTGGGTSGNGTVFSIDLTTGTERVLYSFCSQQNCTDGAFPQAALVDVKGTLYGTTIWGGANGFYAGGTVFALDPISGAEKVVYSFCGQQNCIDGANPNAGVTGIKGVLYGTTGTGGSTGNGTVFAVNPMNGSEKSLYSFCPQQNCADGAFPYATLINIKGMLYSTTVYGGAHLAGTVFAIDPDTGSEKVIYSFCSQQNCADGAMPYENLINLNDVLYSTTYGGGDKSCGLYGCGIVFKLDLDTRVEKTVYSFCNRQNCKDGDEPITNLVAVKNKLYGTTSAGGASGYGTVFVLKQ